MLIQGKCKECNKTTTQRFCDICGKDITKEIKYNIEIKREDPGNPAMELPQLNFDWCMKCTKNIIENSKHKPPAEVIEILFDSKVHK